ncbi:MAG TPA: hypothetical protein PKA82_00825 [Pyrinomonadaceae bacterium]|nr:hypothetical protein [Pyrinomonadaceae bacterium]
MCNKYFKFSVSIGRLINLVAIATFASLAVFAQSTQPSPEPADVTLGGYSVTSSTELGWRWVDVNGSESKYRSDLNYRKGFRSFDSNFLLETENGKGKMFDSLLITVTGWGSDPSGFTRLNMEKMGVYKFDGSVRRVKYYNDLSNHALNEHNQFTTHTFSDFDIVLRPQSELFRFKAGMSTNDNSGPGWYTTRAYSDEFAVNTQTKARSNDFRFGAEGKLWGFDWGLTQGFRLFRDRSSFSLLAPSAGNTTTNTSVLATFSRLFPTDGDTAYTQFNLHRTFAKRFDFTARGIYSETGTTMEMIEQITGRDNSNNFVDLDRFQISAKNKRIQTRGDIGFTYLVNDNIRISDSLSVDRFAINGGETFEEALIRRNAAGNPLASTLTRSTGYRVNDYQRVVNLLEADFQPIEFIGFHVGYRFTNRKVDVTGIDRTLTSAPSSTNPLFINEEEKNSTHAFIAGTKIKPTKNWAIFADVEKGTADNVFTRVENYEYFNFRVRTRLSVKKLVLNASAMTKDNSNPSFNVVAPPVVDFTTRVKNRYFSGTFDWAPIDEVTLSGGYTYRHLTSYTPVFVPVSGTLRQGFSQFFARDHFAYLEVGAKPHKRVGLFAAYRISRDKGQGTRASTVLENFITSYPMQFQSPEFRAAIRLTDNIDWNFGYQYFAYRDSQAPTQNYRSHLPFVSLRIYFGKRAADR